MENKKNIFYPLYFFLLIIYVHGWAFNGYWRADDSIQVFIANQEDLFSLFFIPKYWQAFNQSFFTPGLALAYKISLWLGGKNPSFHYFCLLFYLWLLSWLTFNFLTKFINIFWASYGISLFIICVPILSVTQFLPAQHYIEGLIFVVLALNAFFKGKETDNTVWYIFSALFFLCSMLFKEVFPPLILIFTILIFLQEKPLKRRFFLFSIYTFTAVIYIFWRYKMLGTLIGGYNGHLGGFNILYNTLERIIWFIIGPPDFFSKISIYFLCLFALIKFLEDWRLILWFLAIVIAIVTPLLGVQIGLASYNTDWTTFRLGVVPAWVFFFVLALLLSDYQKKNLILTIIISLTLGFSVFASSFKFEPNLRNQISEYDMQSKFYATHHGDNLVTTNKMIVVNWITLNSRIDSNNEHPKIIYYSYQLSNAIKNKEKIYAYDFNSQSVKLVDLEFLNKNSSHYLVFQYKAKLVPSSALIKFSTLTNFLELSFLPKSGRWDADVVISDKNKRYYRGLQPSIKIQKDNNLYESARFYFDDLNGHLFISPIFSLPKKGAFSYNIGYFLKTPEGKLINEIPNFTCKLLTPNAKQINIDTNSNFPFFASFKKLSLFSDYLHYPFVILNNKKYSYFSYLYQKPEISSFFQKGDIGVSNMNTSQVQAGKYNLILYGYDTNNHLLKCKLPNVLVVKNNIH